MTRPVQESDESQAELAIRAPLFENPQQDRRLFRLQSLLGRHRIVLVFLDSEKGLTRHPWFSEWVPKLRSWRDQGEFHVVVVSQTTAYGVLQILKNEGAERVDCPVVADPDGQIRTRYRLSPPKQEGIFAIERNQTIVWQVLDDLESVDPAKLF